MRRPFFQRVRHRLLRMRLRPIPVFVFHQVSDVFQPETMWECDWTQTALFKQKVLSLMKKYTFISLEEVRDHLKKDRIRFRNYAALTADDGWASLVNILPWLTQNKIPVTLFLNPSCLDGKHRISRETDKLLTEDEVRRIVESGSPFISVASHGWTHKSCTEMSQAEFEDSVLRSETVLTAIPSKVSFFAFASGRYTAEQVVFLRRTGLTPVFIDGMMNETAAESIHRYCMDAQESGIK